MPDGAAVSRENSVLGIDIGGTRIKAALVDCRTGTLTMAMPSGTEIFQTDTPQPATPAALLSAIKQILSKWSWKGKTGCGFPGVIRNGKILTGANVSPEWLGMNLLTELKKLGLSQSAVINDADAAGLAEMNFGAGVGHNKKGGGVVLLVTLGTGIGSALFVDGILLPNTEFGHMEVDGAEIEKQAATSVQEKQNLSWEEWGKRVNRVLSRLEKLINPDFIIIGGGVSERPEKFFPYLKLEAETVPAKMSNQAGIVGAAWLADKLYHENQ